MKQVNGELKSVRVVVSSLLLLIATFLLLAGRCFYLQHFKSSHYDSTSIRQQQKLVSERAQRGEILDSRGRVLAASKRVELIKAEPRIIKDPVNMAKSLSRVIGVEPIEIYKRITESKNPGSAVLKRAAGADECSAARRFYGIGTESDWQRQYPMGRLACHVVGFASRDNRGLDGIELWCEKELRGLSRQNIFLADSRRRPIRLKEQTGVFSDGSGIILTIDATIQQFVRSALVAQCEAFEAESGTAIVAEPRTGAILAMVSLPDFEPAEAGSTDPDRFRNRAITDQFEPGSIFKPIVAAIALDAGLINKTEKIFCEDGYYHGRGFGRITEYRGHRYGQMAVREILVKSSNIGMAKIGQKLGRDRLYKGLTLFGFGKVTGIDLPGEVSGLLRPPGKWTGYSVTRIPFGQEISSTAIQLVRAFCILSNGGRSVRPFVVRAMIDNDGTVTKLKRAWQTGIGYVIKPEVARWVVTEALVGVVNEGTGKRAKLEDWQVFGKTGTANIAKSNERGYSDTDYVASFISGAPAENPAIVVLVSIRKPNKKLGKGYTGGAVASPAAAKIIEKTLNYLGVPKRAERQVARR